MKSLEINLEEDQLYVSAPGIYAVEDYLRPATICSARSIFIEPCVQRR